jgi:transposase InsO family protein
LAIEDNIWANTAISKDEETCRITTARKANRGHTPLETMDDLIPGSFVMVDIVTNPATSSITATSYFPYYLAITDVTSRLFVPLGLRDKTADSGFRALQEWATYYGPTTEFNLFMLTHIHGDFDSAFTSATLQDFARAYNIQITFAATRSQHQNGIHESNWKNIRNMAFAMMTQARVPMKFFHFALEHARKLHSVLPHRALTKTDGTVQCPLGVYFGHKVSLQNFRVLFCPVLMITNVRVKYKHTGKPVTLTTKNHPQRGLRGIYIGLPRRNTGWLVFVPSNNTIYHSLDVYFDERFESTIAFESNRYPGYADCVITDAQSHEDLQVERTGSALWFSNKKQLPNGNTIQTFAQPQVKEEYDIDLNIDSPTTNISVASHDELNTIATLLTTQTP